MTRFSRLTQRGQVRRVRALAEAALTRFPLTVREVAILVHGENTTFRVRAEGAQYVLRIHRRGYHRPEQIDVELDWLDALSRDTDLCVPRPQRGRDGCFRQEVGVDGVPGTRSCVLFAWIDGRFLWNGLRPVHARRLGELTARLHEHAQRTQVDAAGVRGRFDLEGLCGRRARFGAIEDVPGLTEQQLAVIAEARTEIGRRLAPRGTGPDVFGFIHADLHDGNVLFRGSAVHPIDFDDCTHGYWMYDLAVSVRCLRGKRDFARYRDALLEGYASVRPLSARDAADVETLYVTRRLSMLGWVASRSDVPRIAAHLPRVLEGTLATCGTLLSGDPILD